MIHVQPADVPQLTEELSVSTRELMLLCEQYAKVLNDVLLVLRQEYPKQNLNILLGVGNISQHVTLLVQSVNMHTQCINAVFHDMDVLLAHGVDIGAATVLRGRRTPNAEKKGEP